MPDLETIIREAAKRGELVHISVVAVAGGFAASYTPASMYGVTHTRNADPVAAIASGCALDTFKQMIKAQGGDPEAPLPRAAHRQEALPAPSDGWVTRLDARAVGVAAWRLGAGRARKEDSVSYTAGIRCLAKPGEHVSKGDPVVELYADDPDRFAQAAEALSGALAVASEPPLVLPLIADLIGN